MVSASAPAWRFLPCLSSFDDELWCGGVGEINPCLHKLLLAVVVHHSNGNPDSYRPFAQVEVIPNASLHSRAPMGLAEMLPCQMTCTPTLVPFLPSFLASRKSTKSHSPMEEATQEGQFGDCDIVSSVVTVTPAPLFLLVLMGHTGHSLLVAAERRGKGKGWFMSVIFKSETSPWAHI